ncbi:Fe2+-dependent dioxygenase [Nitrospirillum viridazoti]|uniref:Fe2+-dependent dioxygenase n=1 Tax=Nitrospirillum viridazoti CBAmc TaxID=1441467 RepID=A0A248K2F0_9PROT|nr:Fe2+-dependent dioxygenase [Nitrospirillum amazonense]ASG24926.1 Fe2+-dependent dioxygenase [Nitrospirillum amazonense CBAmc]TWB30003.1 PKHD-type hydroxylase [Nitrospirillum amazonense]
MITIFPNVLSPQEVSQLLVGLRGTPFADGAATAGEQIRQVKKNLQLQAGMPGYDSAFRTVVRGIERCEDFRRALFPLLMAPLAFNRYDEGMEYGAHNDMPVINTPDRGPIRADISFTLFLCDPASYDGGELVIDQGGHEQGFKPAAGSLVAYPSGAIHRVAKVTRGTRMAAVGWLQSMIRRPEHRSILYDLGQARTHLHSLEGKSAQFDALARIYANLMREWTEL